jgi:predicted MFS family arabinose efflux permease
MKSGVTVQIRRFRLLAGAYAISSFGSQLNMVALNLFAYRWTGSALGMGAVMIVRLVAGSISGPIAPRLLARFSYKGLLFWTNVVQATALVSFACSPDAVRTAALVAVAVVGGAAGTVFMVALRSAVPDLVGPDRRTWANSLLVTGRSLAMVAGFASAGVVVSFQGYTAAFLIDATTFALCAVAVASLRFPERVPEASRPGALVSHPAGGTAALPGVMLLTMVGLRAVDSFGSASHNAALPVYSASLDPADPAAFVSAFLTSWAIGNIAIQQTIRRLSRRGGTNPGLVGFTGGTALMAGAFILGFVGLPFAVTTVIAFVAGCADGYTEVSYTNHLQTLPGGARDRAFGLSASVENLGFGVGMATSAVLLNSFAPLPVVAASHGVALAFALVLLVVMGVRGNQPTGTGEAVDNVARTHRDSRDRSAHSGS